MGGAECNKIENTENGSSVDLESSLPYGGGLEIHKVNLPPPKTTLQALRHRLGEVFFPDDPLRQLNDQTCFRRFVLCIQYIFPIFQWGTEYNFQLFKSDLVSGLTIASLAIPQGISYAKLANLPPIIGLYSSFVPPLIYAVLGSSRDLAVGPVSIASLVMGSMLREAVSPDDTAVYIQLAFIATFFAGVFQASLGLFRLGFIVDFLSKPTLIGFMGGSAIIVSLQQLKGLFGITHFTNEMGLIPVLFSVFNNRSEWAWQTILMGFSFLAFLLITRHVSMVKPKFFWVSAAAPLTSVILSTMFVYLLKADKHGIKIIGELHGGLNPPSVNMLRFHGEHLSLVVRTGVVTGILSLTEGIAVGRTFGSMKNYQIDGNKEMMAIGAMNMIGSCASCYVTTGSFSRSAVNYNAGSKTAISNIVLASAVLITLLFLIPLFYYTPNLILSAIIIIAVIGLIDYRAIVKLWKVDKFDFLSCITAFIGVLFVSVQSGLLIAVGISILKIFIHVTRPNTVIMGNIPGTQCYQNISHYREATKVPSFLIIAIESPIYFANSVYLQERLLRWVREEEEQTTKKNLNSLKCVILDLAAVTSIDTSGLETLVELRNKLNKRDLKIVLANPSEEVMEKLYKSQTLKLYGSDAIYMTVGEAVSAMSNHQ
ncbi:putative sulfate transporter 3.4 [Zostera marina]|uniref:Putative sulfate transporter 3.4 n=1 Tax=Zostera marina TaxID=29655 RepID=A0A0K9PRM7_ZOSMR|nr:putative sulfate transporter 3.4 [Zostera marina]